ncbi:MAG: hypothetical protein M4579_002021 [Chaenotheca gracillima]|nr:MAG: hypothetical protein M4579_002021 [Chaenotheca gracillima]
MGDASSPTSTTAVSPTQPQTNPLPFWLVNVPNSERPPSCPDFLLDIKAKNRGILGTPDEEYHRHSWTEVKHIIATNRIDLFGRVPSELRRYLGYTWKLKQEYGSVVDFVLQKRLCWTDLTPKNPIPFADPDDIKILYNDWPYGINQSIVHLVIWTKFDLEDDPATDDLTPNARREIDEFVQRTFCTHVKPENVIWFKNWRSLKSVQAVEHFHVMLYEPDMEFVRTITGNDVPLSEKV